MRGVSHTFAEGDLHALIGPSGCGKTTILYLLAGLLSPVEGGILLRGAPVQRGREKTAVILQDFGLFPWKTVRDNLLLGLRLRRVSRREAEHRVAAVLSELGLAGKEALYPKQLSGGEKQRLAVGRALVLDPDLLLMDEPFSSLDAMTREALQDRLLQIHGNRVLTIVLVTHSIAEAAYLADSIHIVDRSARIRRVERDPGGRGERTSAHFFERCVHVRAELDREGGNG